jgi:POT family proton-dependent oligopeptide transporter
MKFVWGMLLVGVGFLLLLPPSKMIAADNGVQVAAGWLVFVYLFHTLGELCLSPVSLSMVTKLAPQKIVGSIMGFWFLSYALGNFISGWIAGFFPSTGDASMLVTMFSYVFYATFGAGVVLLFFTKPLTRMMGGIK